jgi:hypothetical protein
MVFGLSRGLLPWQEMGKTAPKKRLHVVGAISIFYNDSYGTHFTLERSSERLISMEVPTAVKDSVDSLVMTQCAAK